VVLLIGFEGPAVSLLARIGKDLDAFFIPVDLSPCRAPRRISLDQGRTWYPG